MKKYLFSFLFLLLSVGNAAAQAPECEQWLEKGLQAEANGDYQLALELWFNSRSDLKDPCPSISFEYIRLATEQGLKKYYPMAHSMYMWGLTAENITDFYEDVEAEFLRLKPIMPSETANELQDLLEEKNPALLEKIILFWDNSRLTTASHYNERLLEHWERIAYVREHFTIENQPPYGTDDRGTFYVRFGEPDLEAEADMTITYGDLGNIPLINALGDTDERFPRFMANRSFYNYNPMVTVWKYNSGEYADSELVLLFNKKGNGSYKYLRAIDELIENRAFYSPRSITLEGITCTLSPGILMQWIFYDKLKFTADKFANRASTLNFEITGIKRFNEQINPALAGLPSKLQHIVKAENELKNAPSAISTHLKAIRKISVEPFQYRILDEDGEPAYITFIESRPLDAFMLDLVFNKGIMAKNAAGINENEILKNYRLKHTLEIRDDQGQMINQTTLYPALTIDYENSEIPAQSVFQTPYLAEDSQIKIYAELQNLHTDTKPFFETSFSNEIRGLGRAQLSQKDPLILSPGKLAASDLIVGYQKNESLQPETLFPFVVSNRGEIPAGEPLIVHFELYQLGLNEIGHSQFEIEYAFTKKKILYLFKQTVGDFRTTVSFEHNSDRFSEVLEIQTDGLPAGSYDFEMQFRDLTTNQTVKREIRLHFIDQKEDHLTQQVRE